MADSTSSGPPAYCNYISGYGEGACYQGVIQYGDNGAGDTPELLVNNAGGQFTWQSTRQVLFQGNASIEFAVHAGGGATLTASKGAQVGSASDNSLAHQYITGVQVGVAVITVPKRQMTWTGVAIKFYRAGVLREAIPIPPDCPLIADTYSASGTAFRALQHSPTASDNDAVTITGVISLQGDRGDPNFEFSPSDFYAKILVFTSSCNPR